MENSEENKNLDCAEEQDILNGANTLAEAADKDNYSTSKENTLERQGFIAEGTTCESCAEIIKRQAKKVDGVKEITFDYAKEVGYVTFDKTKTNVDEILYKIEEKGYKCFILDESPSPETVKTKKKNKFFGWLFALTGILVAGYFLFSFIEGIQFPQISQGMGYGLLFLVGLLTGFHCIAMCGGFVVGYTAKDAQDGKKSHLSHIKYGVGKTISYTIIGAIFGLIGSMIAFTPLMRGAAGIIAGLFLILFGIKMLNLFPSLRKIGIKTPKILSRVVGTESKKTKSPLVIGLLNGLMIACGPLQAIYIMAAGTGSMIEGAKLLFIFALGTLPVMLGFGYFASFLSGKMTQKILKLSGIAVIILGLFMMNNGLALTGSGYDFKSITDSFAARGTPGSNENNNANIGPSGMPVIKDGYQEIMMTVDRNGFTPNKFMLKKGIPVKWIIDGKELNGCNNAIQVPAYGLQFNVKSGEQVIEFTPDKEGTIRWSCWMGMIPGSFIVKENIDLTDESEVSKELSSINVPKGSSCSMGTNSASCGCGM